MDAIIIQIPDINDSFSRIIIQDVAYLIRFTYNDTFDYWTFGVYTLERCPIIQGVKIVPGFPLNAFVDNEHMPNAIFACESKRENIGRDDFTNGNARFYYFEKA